VDFFSANSYWGSKPDFRLIAVDHGQPIAHLEFGYRQITVGDASVHIAGIGAVAVHPDHQGKKLGRAMFAHLHAHLLKNSKVDFAFIGCHEEVAGFYAASGFHRVQQNVYNLNPDSKQWETYHGPTLVMPVHRSMQEWHAGELIHLNGMPW
jgi:predicted N-acetyltransferase YhbS